MNRGNPITSTPDYERIVALPRRTISEAMGQALSAELSPKLRRPGSSATLLWEQAILLHEFAQVRGAIAWMPVGIGKTLPGELAPMVAGMNGHTWALIVPSRTLQDKAHHDRRELRKDWILPDPAPVTITIQALSRESNADWFERVKPRVIVIDESNKSANASSAFIRRLTRYLMACEAEGIEVLVLCMSGTPAGDSIFSFWHHFVLALGELAPVPLDQREAERWDSVIAEAGVMARGGPGARRARPCQPGVLGATTAEARAWFAQRVHDTPGIVRIDRDSAEGVPLVVRQAYARDDDAISDAFATFAKYGQLPGGAELITDPLSRYRIDAQLGTGFYLRFRDPQPPEYWREARKVAAAFVRRAIEQSTHTPDPFDTEAQAYRRFSDEPELADWLAVKDDYTPVTEPYWLSTATIEHCLEWLRASDEPSIVWCGSEEFLRAMRTASGLKAYGPGGREIVNRDQSILMAPRDQHMIASWHACREGLNLQPWGRMLVTHPPQKPDPNEQLIGRPHRRGRTEPVEVTYLMGSGGTCDTFERMFARSRWAREIALTQKILRAQVVREKPPARTARNAYRWARGTRQA